VTRRARICTRCRRLNSADDAVCYHCQARLPGDGELQLRGLVSAVLGQEQPAARFYLLLCVGVYLACTLKGGLNPFEGISKAEAIRWGAIIPGVNEPWRVLSAMFVHFGVLHIVFNMVTLHDLGRMLESAIGSGRFLCAFLLTGIAGFLTSQQWYEWRGILSATAGASGGLFGLLGVFIGLLYARRHPAWKQELTRVLVMAGIIAILMPANNAAHAGGLVAGGLLGLWFGRERLRGRAHVVYNLLAAVLVIASLASILACHLTAPKYLRQPVQSARTS
jgi:rhomboid protease GluP